MRRDGPMGMSAAATIISQVAEGLQYARSRGSCIATWSRQCAGYAGRRGAKTLRPGIGRAARCGNEDRPTIWHDCGYRRLPFARPSDDPSFSHPGLGYLFPWLHALLRVTGKVPFPGGTPPTKPAHLRSAAAGPTPAQHSRSPTSSSISWPT